MKKLKIIKCSNCGSPVWSTKDFELCALCKIPCIACPDKIRLLACITELSNTKKLLENPEFRKWIVALGKKLDVDIKIEKKRKH